MTYRKIKAMWKATFVGLSFFMASQAYALPPIPGTYDAHYSVSEAVGNDGISANRFPEGESSKAWSERLVLRRLGEADKRPLSEWMKQAQDEFSKDCESFKAIDLLEGRPQPANETVFFWFCHGETGTEFGRLELAKVLQSQGAIYLMVVGGRVPRYEENKIPKVNPDYERRWFSSISAFSACVKYTQMQCLPGEALFGQTPVIAATPEENAEIALAVSRGKALYNQDYLAWHGSDFAVANKRVPKKGKGLGFIAIPTAARAGTFYLLSEGKGDQPQADTFIADESGNFSVGPHLDSLPDTLAIRFKVLKLAREAKFSMCSPALNTAVVPHENGRDWLVYMMSATQKFEEVWIGGHSRIHVSEDGSKVLSITPSTKACIAFDAKALRASGKNAANPLTQILTNVPTEYHVMQSLTHAVPLTVVTDAGVWRVMGDKIEKYSVDVKKK